MSTRVLGNRAVSPVIGSVLLVLVTILLAAVVGTTVVGSTGMDGDVVSPPVAVSATADESGQITLSHEGGDPIHVDDVAVTVAVDGEPLASQPPVPFFSASGFEPGPTGPFNSASDDRWTVGETGSFVLAETNEPTLTTGSTVEIQITRDGRVLVTTETSVVGGSGDGDEG
jgi:flagellin-like protein